MIIVEKSSTADTRTCDWSKVDRGTLLKSSLSHIADVQAGINFFTSMLKKAGANHDEDKVSDIDGFHKDFATGFKQTTWWDKHRKITRHHLLQDDGIPEDVNLVDVIEMIVDCVMAGMARAGEVYPLNIKTEVLMKAFNNTANILKDQVIVEEKP